MYKVFVFQKKLILIFYANWLHIVMFGILSISDRRQILLLILNEFIRITNSAENEKFFYDFRISFCKIYRKSIGKF